MIDYKQFNMDIDECYNQPFDVVISAMYDSIPSHEMYEVLMNDDVKFLLSYYPKLYSIFSRLHAIVVTEYQQRTVDRSYHLKNAIEQVIKVIKFQYEGLSRRITIERDEKSVWTNGNMC